MSKKTAPASASKDSTRALQAQYVRWLKDGAAAKGAAADPAQAADGFGYLLHINPADISDWCALVYFSDRDCPVWGAEVMYRFRAGPDFPSKPPSFECLTPNGQMEPGGPICLGIGEYHADAWRPSLGLPGFITYVAAFMLNFDHIAKDAGGIRILSGSSGVPRERRQELAAASKAYNLRYNAAVAREFERFLTDHPTHAAAAGLLELRRRVAAEAEAAAAKAARRAARAAEKAAALAATARAAAAAKAAARAPAAQAPAAQAAGGAARDTPGGLLAEAAACAVYSDAELEALLATLAFAD